MHAQVRIRLSVISVVAFKCVGMKNIHKKLKRNITEKTFIVQLNKKQSQITATDEMDDSREM